MKLKLKIVTGIACVLLVMAIMLALGVFENKEPTKTPITTWEKRQLVDTGPVKLSLPLSWRFHKIPGIDSYFGEITGDGATLEFDFGRYSNSLVKDNDSKHNILYKTIDGYRAKIVIPKVVGDGMTGIHFGELENQNKFSLYGNNLSPSQQGMALSIFLSIEFTRLWKDGGNNE